MLNPQNVMQLAAACYAAYLSQDDPAISDIALSLMGPQAQHRYCPASQPFAVSCWCVGVPGGDAIVAFAGSRWAHWLLYQHVLPTPTDEGWLMDGQRIALQASRVTSECAMAWLDEIRPSRVTLVGHSLGGVVAIVMADAMATTPDRVVTIGAPRSGLGDWLRPRPYPLFHVKRSDDIIPSLPPGYGTPPGQTHLWDTGVTPEVYLVPAYVTALIAAHSLTGYAVAAYLRDESDHRPSTPGYRAWAALARHHPDAQGPWSLVLPPADDRPGQVFLDC